jgi:trk system potassium uptake protein TrkH
VNNLKRSAFRLTSTQIIALFFVAVIAIGTLLLCLPIASKSREWTPLLDSAFTATSATCVTGLIVRDTFTHWSLFGQLVILTMIQIGGLGVMTIIMTFSVFAKKKISLYERKLLMQSAGTIRASEIIRLLRQITKVTLICEGAGAVILATRFCPELGIVKGLYYSVFHAVSAFCNAGFDLMGRYGQFSSLTPFYSDITVNITVCALIICGGIGFIVWQDIVTHGIKFKKYSLHSKIALTTSATLILSGWLIFFLVERNSSLSNLTTGEKILAAFFQSVTSRTAGFNTVPLNRLSGAGVVLMSVLMMIGGSPGSTAGGIKTTTVAVMFFELIAAAKGDKDTVIFKRRLEDDTVKRAGAIISAYTAAVIIALIAISSAENLPLSDVLFEVASAVGTVGLTVGITPSLSSFSHIILMLLMFAGRIGGLTIIVAFAERREHAKLTRPTEKILIG